MLKNIVYLFGIQGVNYLIPLIILPYLVRVLGPIEYGRLGFSLAIIQYLILIIDFGFNLLTSSRIAKNKNNSVVISKIFSTTIYAKLIIAVVILTISIFLTFFIPKLYDIRGLIYISLIQVVGAIFTPVWFFQGMEDMRKFALVNIFSRFSVLPLIFLFVKDSSDIFVAAFLQSSVFVVSAIIALYIIKRSGVWFTFARLSTILKYSKRSSTIFIGTVAISLYTLSTSIILGFVSSAYEVGIFNASDRIRGAFLGMFVILGSVFYPRINNLIKYNKVSAYILIKKIFIYQSIITIMLSVLFYKCSPYIVRYYLGADYSDSIILLKIMSPMIFLVPASIVLSNYILLPLGYRKQFSLIPVCTALIHFVYAVIFSYKFGAIGASYAILITESMSFLLLLTVNIKLKNIELIFGKKNEKS